MLTFLTDSLNSLLYPRFCGSCGRIVEGSSDGAACAGCWAATKIFDVSDSLCSKCGRFLTELPVSEDLRFCSGCGEHHYDRAVSAGIYHKALAACVLHLKREPIVPRRAERILTEAFERLDLNENFTIIPVPLSKKRTHERGFNQASILAAAVAKQTGQPVDEHTLTRERHTPMHRAAMDRLAREATVRNAFVVARPRLIIDRNVLLVDDLLTSGATVSQCAKVLKKNGAARVDVLTLARAD